MIRLIQLNISHDVQTSWKNLQPPTSSSKQYQEHLKTRNKTIQGRRHQNLKTYRTIPKRYLPASTPQLITESSNLDKEFRQQYENLFFQHLDKVIINNTITLELEKARLQHIILQTEQQLATLTLPAEDIEQLHQQFLGWNNITDHDPLPELRSKLPIDRPSPKMCPPPVQPSPTSSTPKKQPKATKKRRAQHHPNAKKQQKPNHFLAQRPPNNPPPI